MAMKTIVGMLGAVPEVRAAGQRHVAAFSVAETKRRFDRDRNEWVDDFTLWHNCETWTHPDEVGRLGKGELVIVEGEEVDASYESRETGKKVARVVVRARTVGVVVRGTRAAEAF